MLTQRTSSVVVWDLHIEVEIVSLCLSMYIFLILSCNFEMYLTLPELDYLFPEWYNANVYECIKFKHKS